MKTGISIRLAWLSGAALSFNLLGCGADAPAPDATDDADLSAEGKDDAWNTANNPLRVDRTFKVKVAELPLSGSANVHPWAGDYWATARNSINVRWDGNNDSPAAKAAKAFGLPRFPEWVTNNVGIYAQDRPSCAADSDCTGDDGSICATPDGATGAKPGRCIPTWWGICHGWAPAAVMEPTAKKSVTVNGVTFYPGDIQALASFAYQDEVPTKFISERCDAEGRTLHTDNSGRVRESECRDMNAGTVMVVLGNMLGLRKQGIVEDRTYDDQVWNQPIQGYEVTNGVGGKLKQVTKAEAIRLVGGTSSSYTWNTKAKKFFHVELSLRWITEAAPGRRATNNASYVRTDRYAFVLEADATGNAIGGEYIGASKKAHPDFMWWPTGTPTSTQGGLTYRMVKQLIDAAK